MGKFKITKDTKNIHCRVRIGENPEADGTILRQKSSKRFLVTDGKNTGICTVSDLDDNSLVANAMTLSIEKGDGTLQRVEYLSNKFALGFDKSRYIITGANTDAHENATVLTDEAKAKLTKPKAKKSTKKTTTKKTTTKKASAKKKPVAKKAPVKKTVTKKTTTVTKKDESKAKTPKTNTFDFNIVED